MASSNSDVTDDTDDLIVKRKAGGSIIDQRPLFSNDGETLYLVRKNAIRVYSTQTGDFVQEFEPSDHRIVGIQMHPGNDCAVMGCTEKGQLDIWSYPSSIIIKKLPLKLEGEKAKVKTFHIIKYKISQRNEVCEALVTHLSERNSVNILSFDIKDGTRKSTREIFNIKSQEYYVDVIGNHENNLIALLHDSNLHIINPASLIEDILHKTGKTNRLPTCIAGHPVEECVATGDSTGRVVVWRNLFQTRPYTAVFHWHTLPVRVIAFSKSGGNMYTGGGECVLVKWSLANPLRQSFLPRLPAPIKHLTIAPDNLFVAVSTIDNGILIVSPQKKVTAVIQSFTWGVAPFCKDLFPAGLVVDPRTGSLVLNSRTGHVQFYNTHTKNLLYNIDITAQNFLTQERDVIIVNTEVTKIALNHDGTWMATVEVRKNRTFTEVRLKFWNFDPNEQTFKLNTSFERPHKDGVNALYFQPSPTCDDGELLAVTTGMDKKFKLWILEPPTEAEETSRWYLYKTGDYRNLNATDAGFAFDGSLLAVGFDSTVAFWIPETFEFKKALTHGWFEHPIKRIEFGKEFEVGHLVVVATGEYIMVWNIHNLRVVWTVPLDVTHLTYDPKSIYMAALTTDNSQRRVHRKYQFHIGRYFCTAYEGSTQSIVWQVASKIATVFFGFKSGITHIGTSI
ncbi:WD repeat-containing protein 75 isoform X2 [Odontomachus brunneus]|uniref:WD repeat-containing protein 75 isoform X2 n=1 Tax=Odontomachus brunneus TaxID=486640 RepID=UPI0013F254F9|nr:WD repeat-containing protein 75 isoform X2 [Odontomachus brunneus]